ncbi:unnamed protein product [Effrenium voratum]|nr:unnamed protein product [Effrenium voratum]
MAYPVQWAMPTSTQGSQPLAHAVRQFAPTPTHGSALLAPRPNFQMQQMPMQSMQKQPVQQQPMQAVQMQHQPKQPLQQQQPKPPAVQPSLQQQPKPAPAVQPQQPKQYLQAAPVRQQSPTGQATRTLSSLDASMAPRPTSASSAAPKSPLPSAVRRAPAPLPAAQTVAHVPQAAQPARPVSQRSQAAVPSHLAALSTAQLLELCKSSSRACESRKQILAEHVKEQGRLLREREALRSRKAQVELMLEGLETTLQAEASPAPVAPAMPEQVTLASPARPVEAKEVPPPLLQPSAPNELVTLASPAPARLEVSSAGLPTAQAEMTAQELPDAKELPPLPGAAEALPAPKAAGLPQALLAGSPGAEGDGGDAAAGVGEERVDVPEAKAEATEATEELAEAVPSLAAPEEVMARVEDGNIRLTWFFDEEVLEQKAPHLSFEIHQQSEGVAGRLRIRQFGCPAVFAAKDGAVQEQSFLVEGCAPGRAYNFTIRGRLQPPNTAPCFSEFCEPVTACVGAGSAKAPSLCSTTASWDKGETCKMTAQRWRRLQRQLWSDIPRRLRRLRRQLWSGIPRRLPRLRRPSCIVRRSRLCQSLPCRSLRRRLWRPRLCQSGIPRWRRSGAAGSCRTTGATCGSGSRIASSQRRRPPGLPRKRARTRAF